MGKVIQIRGVPDDVHRKLVQAADREGKSLTAYLHDELVLIARRADIVWHNREVILAVRAKHGAPHAPRKRIVAAIEEGRAERDEQIARATGRRGK